MRTTTDTGSFAELRALAGLSIADLVELVGVSERTLYRWECGEVAPKKGILELIRDKAAKQDPPAAGDFTFIDLFAGIGGLRRGFDAVGGKCVFTSEWDRYAQTTYKANYHCDHEVAGDITQLAANDIPAHDVLLAGFPCQPFSIAGVSKKNSLGRLHGFRCDAQGTLFFDVARIIEKQLATFFRGNIKRLLRHDRSCYKAA